jgi:hypothetical protein
VTVRYFGHSQSDSFDGCGGADETGCLLDVCFVQLVPCQCLAHAVLQVKVLLVFGVSMPLPGMKPTGHKKRND